MRKGRWVHGILTCVSVVILLSSCAPAPVVLLSPEVANLKPYIEKAVPRGTKVELEGATCAAKNVVRVTSTPGWNLPSDIGSAMDLPASWNRAYEPLNPLASLGRNPDGSWRSIPLFFDVWGKTEFVSSPSVPVSGGDWSELLSRKKPSLVFVAGSRPSFRQMAFYFSVFQNGVPDVQPSQWFTMDASAWSAPSSLVPSFIRLRIWAPDVWFFSSDDQKLSYKPTASLTFLETYRDYELANPAGIRRFIPLRVQKGTSSALSGIVIFAEYRGERGALKRAGKIISSLTMPSFQKEVGSTSKWLAASLSVPEIDGDSALIRRQVARSDRFFPLTDRLPSPLVERNLLVEIQLAYEHATK